MTNRNTKPARKAAAKHCVASIKHTGRRAVVEIINLIPQPVQFVVVIVGHLAVDRAVRASRITPDGRVADDVGVETLGEHDLFQTTQVVVDVTYVGDGFACRWRVTGNRVAGVGADQMSSVRCNFEDVGPDNIGHTRTDSVG